MELLAGASADGRAAWRLDQQTGRVSVCGVVLTGAALSEADQGNDAELQKALASNDQTQLQSQIAQEQDVRTASVPRCSQLVYRYDTGMKAGFAPQLFLARFCCVLSFLLGNGLIVPRHLGVIGGLTGLWASPPSIIPRALMPAPSDRREQRRQRLRRSEVICSAWLPLRGFSASSRLVYRVGRRPLSL